MRDPFTLMSPPAITVTLALAAVKIPRGNRSLPTNEDEPTVTSPWASTRMAPPASVEIVVENISRFPARLTLMAAPEVPRVASAWLSAGPTD
jgi:hypothetical protein